MLTHIGMTPDQVQRIRERCAQLAGGAADVDVTAVEDADRRYRRERAEYVRRRSLELSTLPVHFAGATFADYRESLHNGRALVAAKRCIDSDFRAGMGLYGEPGVGKSHLAAIVFAAAIAAGHMAIYTSAQRMLSSIRDAYNGDDSQERGATEVRMIERYAKVPVLVLNDLGKEQLTPWSLQMLFHIFDLRWDLGRPLIVTANLSVVQLAEHYRARLRDVDEWTGGALMDRVAGMTGIPWVEITGQSLRWGE
jgi:DNA replication protein DnaC